MDTLDQKLLEYFDGKVVRKDLLHRIKKGTNVPTFVLEFLLARYCASDDPTTSRNAWAYCVLDNDYSPSEFGTRNTPAQNFQVTAAHEYFHAVQFGYDVGEDFVPQAETDSYLYKVGNRDIVRGMAECHEVLTLIEKEDTYAGLYVDLVKLSTDVLDSYFWIGHADAQDLAEPLGRIRDAAKAAVDKLDDMGIADRSRILVSGHSYGGFMTAYALTHSTRWSAGIAGAPVTDWRDYDTVYTERYMRTPQNNPDGYRRTAPRFAAARLQGRLLLIHGTMDDNVHVQNTLQFAYELQRAGKPFEMMLYPRSRHGIGETRLNRHVRQLMLDFALRAGRLTPS